MTGAANPSGIPPEAMRLYAGRPACCQSCDHDTASAYVEETV